MKLDYETFSILIISFKSCCVPVRAWFITCHNPQKIKIHIYKKNSFGIIISNVQDSIKKIFGAIDSELYASGNIISATISSAHPL